MNTPARDWRNIPPIPLGLGESLRSSRVALAEYLTLAFEASFGQRPSEVLYEVFPEGLFVGLLVDGKVAVEHNVWAVMIANALRDTGVDVNVYVRAASELEEAEREHARVENEVRGRMRSRRRPT